VPGRRDRANLQMGVTDSRRKAAATARSSEAIAESYEAIALSWAAIARSLAAIAKSSAARARWFATSSESPTVVTWLIGRTHRAARVIREGLQPEGRRVNEILAEWLTPLRRVWRRRPRSCNSRRGAPAA
jgi:hypothetical protein